MKKDLLKFYLIITRITTPDYVDWLQYSEISLKKFDRLCKFKFKYCQLTCMGKRYVVVEYSYT